MYTVRSQHFRCPLRECARRPTWWHRVGELQALLLHLEVCICSMLRMPQEGEGSRGRPLVAVRGVGGSRQEIM
jgi:hypothetical protein